MTFKSQTALDLPVFFNTDEFAEVVGYNDGTGSVNIMAVPEYFSEGKDVPASHGTILVKKSDMPSPEYQQVITIQGTAWTINPGPGESFILGEDDLTWILRIQKEERFNKWRK